VAFPLGYPVDDWPSKQKRNYTAEKRAVKILSEWMTVGKLAWGVRVQDAPNKIGAIGSPRRILAKIRLGFGGIFPKFGASTHRRELSRRATNQFAEVKKFKLLAALPGRCITMDELEDHPIFSFK
jgi:hypothetical protein